MNRQADLERSALEAVDDEALLRLLSDLVRTPSHNPPGDEGTVAEVIADHLRAEGIEPVLEDVHPGRPNVSAEHGGESGPVLLFNGHTDTMPPGEGWTVDPYGAEVRDGLLYGVGSCDMKAGVAAMTEATLAVRRAGIPLRGRVLLDAVVDEEATGSGTKWTISGGKRADFAVITEPTELEILRLGNGQVNFTVRFEGCAAHGSTPEAGHNAILDAAAFVAAIEEEARRLANQSYPLIGPPTYNVGKIDGGLRTSIVPASCVVGVDRRIVPGQTVAEAVADLERALGRVLSERSGAGAAYGIDIEYEPFETPEDLPLCRELRLAASETSGREIGFGGLRATTDAVFLTAAGTPTVVFGPGSVRQAHRPDEYVELTQVGQAARALVLTIVRLLA